MFGLLSSGGPLTDTPSRVMVMANLLNNIDTIKQEKKSKKKKLIIGYNLATC